jgi:hypothetical protein
MARKKATVEAREADARTVNVLTLPDFTPTTVNKLFRGRLKDRIRLAKSDRDLVCHYAREQGVPLATGRRRVSLAITYTLSLSWTARFAGA